MGLGRLARKGLLTRRREPGDRRRVALGLSAQGALVVKPDPRTVETAVGRLMGRLPARQVGHARRVLSELAEDLERQAGPG